MGLQNLIEAVAPLELHNDVYLHLAGDRKAVREYIFGRPYAEHVVAHAIPCHQLRCLESTSKTKFSSGHKARNAGRRIIIRRTDTWPTLAGN